MAGTTNAAQELDRARSIGLLQSFSPGLRLRANSDRHENELREWDRMIGGGKATVVGGQEIITDPDVFPAHLGDTTRDFILAFHHLCVQHELRGDYSKKTGLDMGCGNGALSKVMAASQSFDRVIAVDKSKKAVKNARKNLKLGPYGEKVRVCESDLMSGIKDNLAKLIGKDHPTVDVVLFNQPYYPRRGKEKFGLGADGGEKLIRRFFTEIEPAIHDRTEILMSFASDVKHEHNPARIAREFGYHVAVLHERIDAMGRKHQIFRFVKEDVFEGKLPRLQINEAPREAGRLSLRQGSRRAALFGRKVQEQDWPNN